MIPLFRPSVSDAEYLNLSAVLQSGWWGLGPQTARFEAKFAAAVGAAHGVGVSSGTAALQLACEALGVAGGEVIVPALTFASTALAVIHAGARPVFADVDEGTLCLDWADAARKVTRWTRAVIPVWYGGTVVPPPEWWLAGLPVIEDCAHAAISDGAGRTGDLACWSFHAVKNLACGDGGMITTGDDGLDAKLRRLRWCGIDRSTWDRTTTRYGWEYDIREAGHKAHMNDLTAAIGLAQLERLPALNETRRSLVRQYLEAFKDVPWMRLPEYREGSAWHLFAVRVPAAARDRFIGHMLAGGVSAGVHYQPLHTYPVFPDAVLPVTDRVWRELVTLPLFPDLTGGEMDQIVTVARSFQP